MGVHPCLLLHAKQLHKDRHVIFIITIVAVIAVYIGNHYHLAAMVTLAVEPPIIVLILSKIYDSYVITGPYPTESGQ